VKELVSTRQIYGFNLRTSLLDVVSKTVTFLCPNNALSGGDTLLSMRKIKCDNRISIFGKPRLQSTSKVVSVIGKIWVRKRALAYPSTEIRLHKSLPK